MQALGMRMGGDVKLAVHAWCRVLLPPGAGGSSEAPAAAWEAAQRPITALIACPAPRLLAWRRALAAAPDTAPAVAYDPAVVGDASGAAGGALPALPVYTPVERDAAALNWPATQRAVQQWQCADICEAVAQGGAGLAVGTRSAKRKRASEAEDCSGGSLPGQPHVSVLLTSVEHLARLCSGAPLAGGEAGTADGSAAEASAPSAAMCVDVLVLDVAEVLLQRRDRPPRGASVTALQALQSLRPRSAVLLCGSQGRRCL